MNDIKDKKGTIQIEPKIVLEGNELVLRAESWPAYCPVIIKIDDQVKKPTRIALGIRNFDGILPNARGDFVSMFSTVDLKHGKHVLTASSSHQNRTDIFNITFKIMEREKPLPSIESNSESDEENEPTESWYYREQDFYSRRFKKIGYIPENIRKFQLEELRVLRKTKEKFYLSKKGPFDPRFRRCKWNPVGSGPVVVHKRWPGGFRAFAGRTLAIAIDHSAPNIMFIGTANGGIWKSMDFGFTWVPKSDFNSSLAVGSIVIDPKNPSRIFAGTGEFHHTGWGGLTYYGSGILTSTDGGETWTNQMTSPSFQGDEISKVLFDPLDSTSQHMFLSSATGIYESMDGGFNWTQLRAGSASDLVALAVTSGQQSATKLIAAFYGSGLWTATKTGVNWSAWVQLTSSSIPAFPSGRIALGQSKNNPHTIYALFASTGIEGIAKTNDGGFSWDPITVRFNKSLTPQSTISQSHSHKFTLPASDLISIPSPHSYITTSAGSPAHSHNISFTALDIQHVAAGKNVVKLTDNDASGHNHSFTLRIVNQLWYNLHISIHPNDTNIIYLGEIAEWKNSTGGGTFEKAGELHADQHCLEFDPVFPDSRVWLGSDGGIFCSEDSGKTFMHRNQNLDTLQYISISMHPNWETIMLGGTQDNGTHRYSGNPAWEFVAGGDGGFTAIDPNLPTRMYHGYTNNTFYRSDDAGITWVNKTGSITGSAEFYPPFNLDQLNSNVCYFGNEKLWRSDNYADTWSPITDRLVGNITAIAGHPFDSNIIYTSTTTGRVYKVQRTGTTWAINDVTTTDITTPPIPLGVYTSDLAVDNTGNVWLTVSSVLYSESTGEFTNDHVYMLPYGSSNWQTRSNNLPRANPINTIVIDPANHNRLFCGGDIGVYRTNNGGLDWFLWDDGLPYAPVFDLKIHSSRRIIRAATHGRSVWERPIDYFFCRKADLYIRDNILDSGRLQPSPESPIHPFDPTTGAYHWESVDIKVDSPEPEFETIESLYDYASFEGKLIHETPVLGKVNKVYAQIHNRGTSKVTDVKVRVFFARAAAGLPPLPYDFWSPGKPFDSNPTGTDWLPIGPVMYLGDLEPAKPKLGAWDWDVPYDLPEHSCLLALTTCNEDPLVGTGIFDVDALVTQNKRVALKNLYPIRVGVDKLTLTEALILDLNNKAGTSSIFNLGIDWGSLPSGSILLIAFEQIDENKTVGLSSAEELIKFEVSIANDKGKYFKEKINYKCGDLKYLDLEHIYQVTRKRDKISLLPSIHIPQNKNVITMAFNVILAKPLESEVHFKVLQMKDKRIIGGSTYSFVPMKKD